MAAHALHGAPVARADAVTIPPGTSGPYNLTLLQGGIGVTRSLPAGTAILHATAPWSITSWLHIDVPQHDSVVLASFGEDGALRLLLDDGHLSLRGSAGTVVHAGMPIPADQWHAIAATFDGARSVRLYFDGIERAQGALNTQPLAAIMRLAPVEGWPAQVRHFGGSLAQFQLHDQALAAAALQSMAATPPAFDLVTFTPVGVGWPLQVHAWIGLTVPQDPWTLPHAHAPPSAPVAVAPGTAPALQPLAENIWRRQMAPEARAAPQVAADGATLSRPGFADAQWYAATVPGTVLTTLIDRGVYPDPDYGLNNLAIPGSLARQDYWYRTQFTLPAGAAGKRLTLVFDGINYAAEIWLNGRRLGDIRGAFIRGQFDVTRELVARRAMCSRCASRRRRIRASRTSSRSAPGRRKWRSTSRIDGPTFVATEGWDWIPGIRDRDTGLWQAGDCSRHGDSPPARPARRDRPAAAAHRSRRRLRSPCRSTMRRAQRQVTVAPPSTAYRVEKTCTLPPGQTEVRVRRRPSSRSCTVHQSATVVAERIWRAGSVHALARRCATAAAISDHAHSCASACAR